MLLGVFFTGACKRVQKMGPLPVFSLGRHASKGDMRERDYSTSF